eukprot:971902-Rhodomonas_salina.1
MELTAGGWVGLAEGLTFKFQKTASCRWGSTDTRWLRWDFSADLHSPAGGLGYAHGVDGRDEGGWGRFEAFCNGPYLQNEYDLLFGED